MTGAAALSIDDDETNRLLAEASGLVAVRLATFGQTFLRAQAARDEVVDVSHLSVGHEDDPARIRACFDHARAKGFLRQFFATACEENIAGAAGSPAAERFSAIAARLCGLKIAPIAASLHEITQAAFRAEAVNAAGFDTDPGRLIGQVAATMRAVCLITNGRTGARGSGVLVAPHIVATAAHVLEGLYDKNGEAMPGSAADLQIRMDVVAGIGGVAPESKIADDWLIKISFCPPGMLTADGNGVLPSAEDLNDADDIALIRLAEAPGFQRGWLTMAEPGGRIDEQRRGLIFHHHPGGADQKVSFGRHCGYYGPRFEHDCTSLGGSSGGPVLNAQGRMLGVHHGTVQRPAGIVNLGGGGGRLVTWRALDGEAFDPPPNLSSIWEIRKGGRVGTGSAVIGFEALQRQIRNLQYPGGKRIFVATGAANGGRVLFDIVEAMLPANQAVVVRFDRAVLAEIVRRVAERGAEHSQTAGAIMALSARISPGGITPPEKASADPAEAQTAAPELIRALERLPTDRAVWVLVNVSNMTVPTQLSEALLYLYEACAALSGGRGRLVVTGLDGEIARKLHTSLGALYEDEILTTCFEMPTEADIIRYLERFAVETRDLGLIGQAIPRFARLALLQAKAMASNDFHADLQQVLAVVTGVAPMEVA